MQSLMEKMRREQEHMNEREKAQNEAKFAKREAELQKLLQRQMENGDESEAVRMMAELEAA